MKKKGANNSYFGNILEALKTSIKGLQLSIRHAKEAVHTRPPINVQNSDYFEHPNGIVTLSYPYESIPVPENGRYQLHNEIDDCIVCDKCAKICPVDCIEIEAIKAPEEIGKTSDGTSKRLYAARFDIDMAKCCYCGLCTTVCPTECLTMTPEYDFSTFDIRDMIFAFSDMTAEEIEAKKQAAAIAEAHKKVKKQPAVVSSEQAEKSTEPVIENKPAKPVFKPKPIVSKQISDTKSEQSALGGDVAKEEASKPAASARPRPVMKKPIIIKPNSNETSHEE